MTGWACWTCAAAGPRRWTGSPPRRTSARHFPEGRRHARGQLQRIAAMPRRPFRPLPLGHGRANPSPPAMPALHLLRARALWQQGRKDAARGPRSTNTCTSPAAARPRRPGTSLQQHGQTRTSLFTTARSAVGVVTRHNDINIVFLLVIVIALTIIPLPTPVVDTLIGVNMALSFTILMMTMYVCGRCWTSLVFSHAAAPVHHPVPGGPQHHDHAPHPASGGRGRNHPPRSGSSPSAAISWTARRPSSS